MSQALIKDHSVLASSMRMARTMWIRIGSRTVRQLIIAYCGACKDFDYGGGCNDFEHNYCMVW